MPRVNHRFCVWHLWRNFSKQCGSLEIKALVWEFARSRTGVDFERNMARVKVIYQAAWEYLDKWPKEAWTKAYFSDVPKLDNICNNACKLFNAKIKHERHKPILTLAEEIRWIIMKSMIDNRQKLMVYQGILPPVQQNRLEGLIKLSRNWVPHWSANEKECLYEIQSWPTNMVGDLRNHTCTCRFWQLTGMPCMHAIVAIQDKHDKRPEEYCQEWLRMESYKRIYSFNVNPVKGQYLWEKIPSPAPVLPPIKPKPGRPTTKRRKDKNEGPSGTRSKMKRKYNPIKCIFYGEVGHNKKTCLKKK
ncbi:uncharacterized protein LOC130981355 [Arachis stenosperma]|uniref:uncharacterized protein LOC130981355 n=1 Tax=Arachis stenosperma TaxID=217475 RepID=UPI0025AD5F70|nr:uncharacterized protein LOC130981355 [Arachis stenosperma]